MKEKVRVLILGCGRLTESLIPGLIQAGNRVTIISENRECLDAVSNFPGLETVFVAAPDLQDFLRQGDVGHADVFLALSGDDHLNALTAQIAIHTHEVPRVVCRLENPYLQQLYTGLGMKVVGGLTRMTQDIQQAIEL